MAAFYLNFDRLERAVKEKGMTLKKIDTVHESSPEFEGLWAAYLDNDDPMYNICTEPDGKTHTFYRIYKDTNDDDVSAANEKQEVTNG